MVKTERLEQFGLSADEAASMAQRVNDDLRQRGPDKCWQNICESVLGPAHPFAIHQVIHEAVFADWGESRGPRPAWIPTAAHVEGSNLFALMQRQGIDDYQSFYRWSVEKREAFWDCAIERLGIRFREPPTRILDLARGIQEPDWLPGARLNVVESCFQASPDAPAIVCGRSSGQITSQSYGELRRLTNRVSNGLRQCGFAPGDAIAVDMPMTPDSVAIYLGIVQAGCVVVSIADSFAPPQIRTRLAIAESKGIFTTDHIVRGDKRLPMVEKVFEADAPRAVVLPGPGGLTVERRDGDLIWEEFLASDDRFEPHVAAPGDDINVLFSSGTTGDPKAIPWHHTTAIKAAVDGHLHQDIQAAHVVAWPTNLGWMMGPWLIYAGLVNRGTLALYYGVPTDAGFGRFVQDAQVNMLGVIPSLVRAWCASGCMAGLDWSAIRAFSSTGESANPEDMFYLSALAGYKPVIEYCGGTEIAGGYVTGSLVQPTVPGCFTTPTLGLDFVLLDEAGNTTQEGEAFLLPPSIGFSSELLNRDHHQVYYADTPPYPNTILRRHGDRLERLPGGYYRVQGRMDDTMNLGGIKVGSSEIERLLVTLKEVRETAAIAVSPPDGGPSQLVVYAVLNSEPKSEPKDATPVLRESMQNTLRQRLNPLFKISDLVIMDALPRTASNKIMRRVLRDQYRESQSSP